MKIKFVKDYKAFMGIGNPFNSRYDYAAGEIRAANDEIAQWLIDNGFAKKVEQGWPTYDDLYWYISSDGIAMSRRWTSDSFERGLKAIGNVFKTGEPAHQFIDYLKAVETVRHDEGFMKPIRKTDYIPCGYGFHPINDKGIVSLEIDCVPAAGRFYFDNYEHAKASLEAHRDEWQTILNYDWSKE